MDLIFFAMILAVCESAVVKAATTFSSQPYVLSIVPVVVCVVYMRWGIYGCLHAVFGGVVSCFVSKGSAVQYGIYCLGNIFSVLAVLLLSKVGKERVRESVSWSLLFAVLVTVLMQIGRGLVAVLFGSPLGIVPKFILTDSLSVVFSVVVIWICRRLDGVFEDQKTYLLRINREEGGA